MTGQITLFEIGVSYVTVRTLLLIACLALYAATCLYCARKQGVKRSKAALALVCGFAGMALLGKLSYFLLDKNAPSNPFLSGEMTFVGFIGFFAGVRLYCLKSPAAFRRLLKLMAPPFFPFAAAMYLLKDGTAGAEMPFGLFRYTDIYGLKRANVALIQGALLLILILAAYLLQKLLKKRKFTVRLLPMAIAAMALILPAELLRDSTQIKILGMRAEAFIMWLSLVALLLLWLVGRIKKGGVPLINAFIALALPLLAVFSRSAYLSFFMLTVPVILTLSPLFPFVKTLNQKRRRRKRSFS